MTRPGWHPRSRRARPRLIVPSSVRLTGAVVNQSGHGGILKGVDHAGHIPQGGTLQAALGQRMERLAFEIYEDEILAGEKRLAQMLDELAAGDKYMKMVYRPR